uniref:ATP synthase subunit C lysine N-methyltransferase-like n=1 Tax=Myxine glutinosa TaxID=7769 RepID=UPI00358FA626
MSMCDDGTGQVANGKVGNLGHRRWGLVLAGITGGAVFALYAVAVPFVLPALRAVCLPFVPATDKQLANVLSLLRGRRGRLADIGSGDGRIVIAAAKHGFQATGFELNPWLVWYSRFRAYHQGVQSRARFHKVDLWKVNFAEYDNIVIFGVPQMMKDLARKLEGELKSGTRVVACRFPFPTWTAKWTVGESADAAWTYDLPDACRGSSKIRQQPSDF